MATLANTGTNNFHKLTLTNSRRPELQRPERRHRQQLRHPGQCRHRRASAAGTTAAANQSIDNYRQALTQTCAGELPDVGWVGLWITTATLVNVRRTPPTSGAGTQGTNATPACGGAGGCARTRRTCSRSAGADRSPSGAQPVWQSVLGSDPEQLIGDQGQLPSRSASTVTSEIAQNGSADQ